MASNGSGVIPAPPEQAEVEIIVIPYTVATDPIGEVFLPGLWKRLRDEGIFDVFFHDYPDTNFAGFVKALSAPDSLIFMVAKQWADRQIEHMGMVTLGQVLDTKLTKRGVAGFLFFKQYWNHKDADEAGHKVLEYWFDTLGLDVVGGITPKLNRPALAYIHRLGFVSIGDIPHFSTIKGHESPATVSYLTRELWVEKMKTKTRVM